MFKFGAGGLWSYLSAATALSGLAKDEGNGEVDWNIKTNQTEQSIFFYFFGVDWPDASIAYCCHLLFIVTRVNLLLIKHWTICCHSLGLVMVFWDTAGNSDGRN